MKTKYLIYIFVIFSVVIAGCAQKKEEDLMKKEIGIIEGMDNKDKNIKEDLEFKKMCQDAGYEWMLMKPTQDGKIIQNAQTCMGCMVEGIEHICDKEKFMEFVPPR